MFAQRLKDLRKAHPELTQAKLAEILDVSQQAVGLWERGKNMPSHELVFKIASFFNVTTDYLLGLSDQPHGTGFQKELLGDINGGSSGGWQNMSFDDDDDSLDTETQKILADYRQLDEKARETIKSMIEISLRKKANSDD